MEAKLRRAVRTAKAATGRRDDVIREAAANGYSYRRIAALTGLSFTRIGQIVRNE
jgi:hypothetical protein